MPSNCATRGRSRTSSPGSSTSSAAGILLTAPVLGRTTRRCVPSASTVEDNLFRPMFRVETHQQSDPLVGAVLDGRYRVDTLIATGGMSGVYRGLDLRLDRPVALKIM